VRSEHALWAVPDSMSGWTFWGPIDRAAEYARRNYGLAPTPNAPAADFDPREPRRTAASDWRRLAVDLGVTP
jgi:hypothetical protein